MSLLFLRLETGEKCIRGESTEASIKSSVYTYFQNWEDDQK